MDSCLRHVLVMVLLICATLISVSPTHGATPSGTVVINNDAASTPNSLVTLTIDAQDGSTDCPALYPSICGIVYVRFSSGGSNWSSWQLAQTTVPWLLRGNQVCAQFVDGHGFAAPISCDTIQVVGGMVSLTFSDGTSYFDTLADACNNAANGQQVALKQGSLAESVTVAGANDLILAGGYDSDFGAVTGITTLTGNFDLASDVTVRVENMEIAGIVTITSGTLTAGSLTIS